MTSNIISSYIEGMWKLSGTRKLHWTRTTNQLGRNFPIKANSSLKWKYPGSDINKNPKEQIRSASVHALTEIPSLTPSSAIYAPTWTNMHPYQLKTS